MKTWRCANNRADIDRVVSRNSITTECADSRSVEDLHPHLPRFLGLLFPEVHMAARRRDEAGEDTTKLTLTDSLIGHLTEELLGNMVDGWRQLFGDGGLKSHLEPK